MANQRIRRVYASTCLLVPSEVRQVIMTYAADRPLSTAEVAEFCQALYPYPDITTEAVGKLLRSLRLRDLVRTYSGEQLTAAGHANVNRHLRYWQDRDSLTPPFRRRS